MKYETYNLQAGSGKYIRKATRVILEDGRTFQFMERMSNKEAKRQVEQILKKTSQVKELEEETCWKCDGSKIVQAHPHHYLTAPEKMWKCHVCHGTGKVKRKQI